MPITVQVPEGHFSKEVEVKMFEGLTEAILRINGVSQNPFSHRHLIADLQITPEGRFFIDGKRENYANVTLRVPVFALNTDEQRAQITTELTDLIIKLGNGKVAKDRVYINMIYGDGFWGLERHAYSNFELQTTVMGNQPGAGASSRPEIED